MPDVDSLRETEAPPILSTPDDRIIEESVPIQRPRRTRKSDEEIEECYEISRTVREIRDSHWKRVALQFPDDLLVDAPRVLTSISTRLQEFHFEDGLPSRGVEETQSSNHQSSNSEYQGRNTRESSPRLFILADTSYGACCVDEVAAEHADADVVVHYGRACLSPTSRLPVIYVFTRQPLSRDAAVEAFELEFGDRSERVILMADLPYQHQLSGVAETLRLLGYTNVFTTEVTHDAQSHLPNRTVPASVARGESSLQEWALFHVAEPTPSLQLNLASKVRSISFYPANSSATRALHGTTTSALRRRYGILTSLSAVPIFGIIINTLSVRNYMQILNHVKKVIAAAGKKSYTFVVGKVNAAKMANFSEVGGWVVIGCWESSLFDAKDFWKPIITPFELDLALQSDDSRQWSGQWSSNFQDILDSCKPQDAHDTHADARHVNNDGKLHASGNAGKSAETPGESFSEEESEPPEFDLRTGRYVSTSRPMTRSGGRPRVANPADESGTQTVAKKAVGDLSVIAGEVSPAAEFFQNQRSWRGLGSDFDPKSAETDENDGVSQSRMTGANVESGRHGIARGYYAGDSKNVR